MANTKISALPASTTPLAGTEVLPIVQSSTTRQVSVANLTAGRAVATGALTVTGAATVSTTLGVTGAATLNTLASSGATLTGGTVNGMTVGATTATTGAFTSVTASTTLGVTGVATFSAGTAALPALTTTGDTNTGIFFPAADTVATSVAGTEGMRLTSTGLGIGLTAPSAKLHLRGSSSTYTGGLIAQDSTSNFFTFYANGNNGVIGTAGTISFASFDGSSQRMLLDTSGNLGLGVTPSAWESGFKSISVATFASFAADSASTYVSSNVYYNGGWKYVGTGYASNYYQNLGTHVWRTAASGTAGDAISFTQAMTLDASGNFLVAATTSVATNNTDGFRVISGGVPTVQRGAAGSFAIFYNYSNSAVIGSISNSGGTATLFNTTSDQRLKENIVDAPNFGSVIDSIQVRSFDWKSDGTHQRAGFIAQELVTVAPEAVHQPTDANEMMAVDYSKLVPMLVKEIQSLRQRLSAANL